MKTLTRVLIILIGFALLFPGTCLAQETSIFPNLTGENLRNRVAQEYEPDQTLGYNRAKDLMYGQIDNDNGVVTDIYANYTVTLNPNTDPSSAAFNQEINTEHVWPQSKGAGQEPGKSDLHHLFPSRIEINSDRGSKPFGEIPDQQTDRWYRNTQKIEFIPTSTIDEYSESNQSRFEPRESKKGDIARAVFYFATIHQDQINDDRFFKQQRATLCEWDQLDPVDGTEQQRSRAIAQFQGNENPFILDSTLSERMYCNR